jgi:hypothetical protein
VLFWVTDNTDLLKNRSNSLGPFWASYKVLLAIFQQKINFGYFGSFFYLIGEFLKGWEGWGGGGLPLFWPKGWGTLP